MRITSGSLKGRTLMLPKRHSVRPSSERVREAIFSSVQTMCDLSESMVLDLYAGSGALGIEALSRGASHVVFVEKNKELCRILSENIERLGIEEQSKVFPYPTERALHRISDYIESRSGLAGRAFDLVLLDPPYELAVLESMLKRLEEGSLIRPATLIVYEHSGKVAFPKALEPLWTLIKEREYGDTTVSYIQMNSNRPNSAKSLSKVESQQ